MEAEDRQRERLMDAEKEDGSRVEGGEERKTVRERGRGRRSHWERWRIERQ